jgi:hypothetical protein
MTVPNVGNQGQGRVGVVLRSGARERVRLVPTLEQVLTVCQVDHAIDWRLIPAGESGTDLLVGVFETRDSSSPAVTALSHEYRAVYMPDPQIGIGWGMESEQWKRAIESSRRAGVDPNPGWADPDWTDVFAQWAHLLLNGTMVWRVRYTYVNRGAGMDGYMPWPAEDREAVPGDPGESRRIGWSTTSWELAFAGLLNALQGNTWDFDVDRERRWKGLLVREGSPLDG